MCIFDGDIHEGSSCAAEVSARRVNASGSVNLSVGNDAKWRPMHQQMARC